MLLFGAFSASSAGLGLCCDEDCPKIELCVQLGSCSAGTAALPTGQAHQVPQAARSRDVLPVPTAFRSRSVEEIWRPPAA